MKTKTYDCVAMKHIGGQQVYETVKGMTREEELAYWKKRTEELRARLKARRSKRPAA
ncbi:MAG: hypothetical protein Q7T82_21675 [Armatimonadota bacterium]|nr:hypothetical protein [Armatimonadota bacterium]